MNKLIKGAAFFLTLICATHLGFAQGIKKESDMPFIEDPGAPLIERKLQLSFSTGHQQEDFHWSIAGNTSGQNPNVLSELKWKNVSGEDFSAAMRWNFVLYKAEKGWVISHFAFDANAIQYFQ